MLNPAKGTATLQQIKAVPLEKPARAKGNWQGVAHSQLLKTVLTEARTAGLEFKLHAAHVGRHGFDLAAGLILPDPPSTLPALPDGWFYGLGVVSSNSNRVRMRVHAGAYRDLGEGRWAAVVSATYFCEHRFTPKFDLPAELGRLIGRWEASSRRLAKKFARLADRELGADSVQRIAVEIATRGHIPYSRAMAALVQVKGGPCSALDLLAAFGEHAAKNPPDEQQGQLAKVWELVREVAVPRAEPAA